VQRLRALVSQLKLLLPAHNTPTAPPSYLSKLALAIRQVRSGKAKGDPKDGKLDYPFDEFSLLLALRK
jgi:hypothetical protein